MSSFTGKPQYFDGNNDVYWKHKMCIFMLSFEAGAWEKVAKGY